MKRFKKNLLIILFLLCILPSSVLISSAKASDEPPVSPALSIIADGLQMKKSGIKGASLYLTSKDFEDFLLVENLKAVTVSTLPSEFEGVLYLGKIPVVANQKIYKNDLNKLCFVPASPDVSTASFGFFGNEISCEASVKCSLFLHSELNTAPIVAKDVFSSENLTTVKNIMIYSTIKAEDNENDQMIFEVATEAKHGIINFINDSTGEFTYTPALDYVGKDSFEFTVSDIYGNRSEKARVDIKVEKNASETFYSDMLRHEDHLNAVKANDYNIMNGHLMNGKMCFLPDNTPTKAEFLSMALKALGVKNEMIAIETGFTDDSDIPPTLKGYVAYAVGEGYVSGTKNENGIFFYPNSPITRAEAAVLINNIIDAECENTNLSFSDSADIPSWAQKDVAALAELDIMDALSDGSYAPNSNITNSQAANILCKVYEIKNK